MHPTDPLLKDLLPLREPTFYILLSLTGGEKHGYAMLRHIEELSSGELKLSTGTLYEALARLLELEWIERVDGPVPDAEPDAPDQRSKTRKAYRISRLGMRVLRAELNRMQALISVARRHLGDEPA